MNLGQHITPTPCPCAFELHRLAFQCESIRAMRDIQSRHVTASAARGGATAQHDTCAYEEFCQE
jgi:hypothetical protein